MEEVKKIVERFDKNLIKLNNKRLYYQTKTKFAVINTLIILITIVLLIIPYYLFILGQKHNVLLIDVVFLFVGKYFLDKSRKKEKLFFNPFEICNVTELMTLYKNAFSIMKYIDENPNSSVMVTKEGFVVEHNKNGLVYEETYIFDKYTDKITGEKGLDFSVLDQIIDDGLAKAHISLSQLPTT